MEKHPKYHEVADICAKHPAHARAVFQTHISLKYGQQFKYVQALMLPELDIPVFTCLDKHDQSQDGGYLVFVPIYADKDVSVNFLSKVVGLSASLNPAFAPSAVHLAIVENDSTVVYYKIGAFNDNNKELAFCEQPSLLEPHTPSDHNQPES